MSSVISITDAQFEAEVLKSEQPVLIYFWAPWCGPCRLVSPSVNWAADNYGDRLKVVKMEVDPNQESVALCKVEGVPALRLFNHQEVVQSHEGAITRLGLQEMLENYLSATS